MHDDMNVYFLPLIDYISSSVYRKFVNNVLKKLIGILIYVFISSLVQNFGILAIVKIWL